jgi:hypothetical protein
VNDIGVLVEGTRNDGLTRYAGALRRRGGSQSEIEAALFAMNQRRCRPLLPDVEVRQIAASVARYPIGGMDPLEQAWSVVMKNPPDSRYEQLIELARALQTARPGMTIALPQSRIAQLMNCKQENVSLLCRTAVRNGALRLIKPCIKMRRGAEYAFVESPNRKPSSSSYSGLIEVKSPNRSRCS